MIYRNGLPTMFQGPPGPSGQSTDSYQAPPSIAPDFTPRQNTLSAQTYGFGQSSPQAAYTPPDYNAQFYSTHPNYPGGPAYQPAPQTPGTGLYTPWQMPRKVTGELWTTAELQRAGMLVPPVGSTYNPSTGMYMSQSGAATTFYNPSTGQISANSGDPGTELGNYNWSPLMNAALQATTGISH